MMIEIKGNELTGAIKDLYDEVTANIGKKRIKMFYNEKELEEGELGRQEFTSYGYKIIVREEKLLKEVLSHELLHIFFVVKGYPGYNVVPGVDEWSKVGSRIYNDVMHRLIVNQQVLRGIQLSKTDEILLENLNKWERSIDSNGHEKIKLAISILSLWVTSSDKDSIKKVAEDKFPLEFVLAERIFDIIYEKEELTPYYAYRTIVRIYKELDVICRELEVREIELKKKIFLEPVLTERQLEQKVNQVFLFNQSETYEDNKVPIILKSNNQYTMLIDKKDINCIENMLVRDFCMRENIRILTK